MHTKMDLRKKGFEKLAKIRSRKELESELNDARKNLQKARSSFDGAYNQLQAYQNQVENARTNMDQARENIIQLSNTLQKMDLAGADSIRERQDEIRYVVDGKEHHVEVDKDTNDVKMTPWKEFQAQLKEEENNSIDQEYVCDENNALDFNFSENDGENSEGLDLEVTKESRHKFYYALNKLTHINQ